MRCETLLYMYVHIWKKGESMGYRERQWEATRHMRLHMPRDDEARGVVHNCITGRGSLPLSRAKKRRRTDRFVQPLRSSFSSYFSI